MQANAADRTANLNGLNFHYRDWGGQGRPMVLLHGLASNCRIWDLVAPRLTSHYRVLAPDQRGHGLSDGPDDGYDFDSVAQDLEAFVESLKLDGPVLVGHSWGGNVVLHYAADHPQEAGGLVLVDGGTIEITRMPGMNAWEQVQQRLAPPDFNGMTADALVQRVKSHDLGPIWSPEIEGAFLANFHIAPNGQVRPRLTRDRHMQLVRALWQHRPSSLFARIECPTLIVPARKEPQNDRDSLFSESKRQMVDLAQDLLKQGSVLWMDDTIHDIPLQRPKELAEAIIGFGEGLGGS